MFFVVTRPNTTTETCKTPEHVSLQWGREMKEDDEHDKDCYKRTQFFCTSCVAGEFRVPGDA
eukprot:4434421-Amphidinium_carterae.1